MMLLFENTLILLLYRFNKIRLGRKFESNDVNLLSFKKRISRLVKL